MSNEHPISQRPNRTAQHVGAVTAVAIHVVAFVLLLNHAPTRQTLFEAAPLMVELLKPPPPPPPTPPKKPDPPKPRPVVKPQPVTPPPPPPMLVAAAEAPTPVVASPPPPPPPVPAPITAPPAPPAPMPVAVIAPPEPPAPVAVVAPPAPPAPITPPVFNADYLDNPAPSYPAASKRMREQGRVMLRVYVNPAGGAEEVQISSSSGSFRLDEAAKLTVKRWRFVPAKRGKQQIAAWVLVPISFSLER